MVKKQNEQNVSLKVTDTRIIPCPHTLYVNISKYVQEKIDQWIKELRVLCKIAWCEPQAAYSGFIKGFKHKPIYFMRTIPNIKTQLKQLDDVIRTEFIPVITGGINCSDTERRLMFLPPRFGGLGIRVLDHTIKGFNNKHN